MKVSIDVDITVVGEVKTESPFGYESERDRYEQFEFVQDHADMVSIHTNEDWGGSFGWLEEACEESDLPVLAKGLHQSNDKVRQAVQAGADSVLTVSFFPTICQDRVWYEPRSLWGMKEAPSSNTNIVWNERDPLNGLTKKEKITKARGEWDGWLCQASNIQTVDDVNPYVEAVLVGRYFPTFVDSLTE